jgi:PPOX class probable F420-dependent enzyme
VHDELRTLIEAGPLAHLSTSNPDGSPQVTVIWIGLDGDELLSGHLGPQAKLRNIERDPRVVLSLEAPPETGEFMRKYAVIHAHAQIEESEGTWDFLDRLTKIYVTPETEFPAPRGPGRLVRYRIDRVGGVGPWAD